ncbi:MAG TPA: ribonucleotide reductase N-terminal alpha domain-containing protein, partial [Orrella sp.]
MTTLQDITNMQPISLDVLAQKYLKPGEHSAEDIYRRVAKALASVEPKDQVLWQERFLSNLRRGG